MLQIGGEDEDIRWQGESVAARAEATAGLAVGLVGTSPASASRRSARATVSLARQLGGEAAYGREDTVRARGRRALGEHLEHRPGDRTDGAPQPRCRAAERERGRSALARVATLGVPATYWTRSSLETRIIRSPAMKTGRPSRPLVAR